MGGGMGGGGMGGGGMGGGHGGGGGGGRAHFTNMELEGKLDKTPLENNGLLRVDLDDNMSDHSIKKRLKFGEDAIISFNAEPGSKEIEKELGVKPETGPTEAFLGTIIKTES
jgi:hypothetical protein